MASPFGETKGRKTQFLFSEALVQGGKEVREHQNPCVGGWGGEAGLELLLGAVPSAWNRVMEDMGGWRVLPTAHPTL